MQVEIGSSGSACAYLVRHNRSSGVHGGRNRSRGPANQEMVCRKPVRCGSVEVHMWTWALQALLSAATAAAVCGAAYAIRHPPKVSALYAGAIAALFGAVLLVARAILLEREFSVRPRASRPSAARWILLTGPHLCG